MDDEDDLRPAPRRDTGTLLFLSLFLLLLAFFILLNSLATFQESRTRAVLSSVSATFQVERETDLSAEILVSTLGPTPEPEAVMAEVERLWRTAVPVAEVEVLTEGTDMLMEMPVTQVFAGGEPRVRRDREALFDAMATALAARIEGAVVMTKALFHVDSLRADPAPDGAPADGAPADGAPADGAPANGGTGTPGTVDLLDPNADLRPAGPEMDGMPLAMARADAFARALVDRGAPPDGLQVGVREGDPRKIRLRFFVRDLEGARLSFSEAADPAADEAGQ